MENVLDQAAGASIAPLSQDKLRELLEAWRTTHNFGEDPAPEVEATGDQLSALEH